MALQEMAAVLVNVTTSLLARERKSTLPLIMPATLSLLLPPPSEALSDRLSVLNSHIDRVVAPACSDLSASSQLTRDQDAVVAIFRQCNHAPTRAGVCSSHRNRPK